MKKRAKYTSKPVIHLETNKIFRSVSEAARHFKVSHSTILRILTKEFMHTRLGTFKELTKEEYLRIK